MYRPAIELFAPPQPLDALGATAFCALFAAAALLTARRASYGLCVLILCAPFALYREILGTTITLPKIAVLGVLLGLTAHAGVWSRLRDRPMPLLLGAVVIYCAATAATFAHAAHPGATWRETFKAIEYAVCFVAAFLCFRLDPDDRAPVACIGIAAIAVCAGALAQEFAGAPSVLCLGTSVVPRIAGAIEGPNQLAGYCEIAAATLGVWSFRRPSALSAVALALVVCTGVLTFSRAGLLAFAAIAVVLALAAGRAAMPALRAAAAGAIAGAAVAAGWALHAHGADVLRVSFGTSACTGGVGDRAQLWPAAWRMWLRHPWLGSGAGNFELNLPDYGVFGVRTHANSWYLQSLAEGGVLLFAAVVALIGAILTAMRDPRTPWALAGFAATAGLALHQVFDDLVFYPKVAVPWFLLLGIAAAALAARGAPNAEAA